jgi:hypothetical protein
VEEDVVGPSGQPVPVLPHDDSLGTLRLAAEQPRLVPKGGPGPVTGLLRSAPGVVRGDARLSPVAVEQPKTLPPILRL